MLSLTILSVALLKTTSSEVFACMIRQQTRNSKEMASLFDHFIICAFKTTSSEMFDCQQVPFCNATLSLVLGSILHKLNVPSFMLDKDDHLWIRYVIVSTNNPDTQFKFPTNQPDTQDGQYTSQSMRELLKSFNEWVSNNDQWDGKHVECQISMGGIAQTALRHLVLGVSNDALQWSAVGSLIMGALKHKHTETHQPTHRRPTLHCKHRCGNNEGGIAQIAT